MKARDSQLGSKVENIDKDKSEAGSSALILKPALTKPQDPKSQETKQRPRQEFVLAQGGTKQIPLMTFSRNNRVRGMMGRGRGHNTGATASKHVAGRGVQIKGVQMNRNTLGVPHLMKQREGKNKSVMYDEGIVPPRSFSWKREEHGGALNG